jgi:hypothetical protein
MHNHACLTLDGSDSTDGGEGGEEERCPKHKFTERSGDFTSRNGGWTREGMTLLPNELCKRVKEDRQADRGAFAKVCREHRVRLGGKKRKRRMADGGAQLQIAMSDDLEDLWTAAATETTDV